MLRYFQGNQIRDEAALAAAMFRDRRGRTAEGGADPSGDAYDALNPLNVIWQLPGGAHGGSVRLLPTTGRKITAERFARLGPARPRPSPFIWEWSRLCLAPGAAPQVLAALMLGAAEVGRNRGLTHLIGLIDPPRLAACAPLGWEPTILGRDGGTALGLWDLAEVMHRWLCVKAGVLPATSAWWYAHSRNAAVDATRTRCGA